MLGGIGLSGSPAASWSLSERARGYVALTKPRIVELLLVTTVPTMFVASSHVPSARLVLLTLLGGSLAAGGANALNMVYDRDIDAKMERTKGRPLVTGVLTPTAATLFAFSLEVAAFLILWLTVNLLSSTLAVSATAFYVGVYTMWLKRRSTQNIVIGGAAGAVPVLVGWSAVTDRLSWAPLLMFGLVFLWTPPHFWALAVRYRDDYTRAEVPMLPSVVNMRSVTRQILLYSLALFALSLLLAPVAHLGPIYLCLAALLGIGFVGQALALRRDPELRSGDETLRLLDCVPRRPVRIDGSRRVHPPSVSRARCGRNARSSSAV